MQPTPVDPEFVLQHAAHVRALAARLVFDGARAEDLAQETWLAALRNAPRSMTSPRGWLARIAQRRAVQDWRAEAARTERERSTARPEGVPSTSEVLEREELRAVLVRAVLALDEPYRSALVVQFFEERAPRDAARHRGVALETHRTHVKRGLGLLRRRSMQEFGAAFGAFQFALVRDLRLEVPASLVLSAASSGLVIGGLTMWTAKEVAVAAVTLIALGLGVTRPWEEFETPSESDSTRGKGMELQSSSLLERPPVESPRASALDSAATAEPATSGTSQAVVLRARIVDPAGRAIEGARARPMARDEIGRAVPCTLIEAASDANGVVRIEGVVPTAPRLVLEIDGGADRTRGEFTFEDAGKHPIRPGENDAGEIVLRPAGSVTGSVIVSGVERAGAYVWVTSASSPVLRTASEADGRFTIANVPAGLGQIEFKLDGFLERREPIKVTQGSAYDVGGIELLPAPSIAGSVVDEGGMPVASARIRARSTQSLGGGFASSGDDGSFRVFVEDSSPHDLEMSKHEHFAPWGGRGVEGARANPGDENVRIVLQRLPLTTFRIVDAATSEPVEEFGIAVRLVRPRSGMFDTEEFDSEWPAVLVHARGIVEVSAAAGMHEVFVHAPEHAPVRATVAHDVQASDVQTIRLGRAARLLGRLVRAGNPGAHASLRTERALVPLGPEPRMPGSIEIGRTHDWDLSSYAGRERACSTDSEGRFVIDGLAAGTYTLSVVVDGASQRVRELISVPGGEDLDLGDVALPTVARIVGRIDVGASSAAGWQISVRGRRDAVIVERDDGRFVIEGLPAGPVGLIWWRSDTIGLMETLGSDKEPRAMSLSIREGETREVSIDARDIAPGRIVLATRVDGEAPVGARVRVANVNVGGSMNWADAGWIDARGTWSQRVRPGMDVAVQVQNDDGLPLLSTGLFRAQPGEERRFDLDGETGELVVRFADAFELPDSGSVQVDVNSKTGPRFWNSTGLWSRHVSGDVTGERPWTERTLVIGRCGVGTWTVDVSVFDRVRTAPNGWRHESLLEPMSKEIVVQAGRTTIVEMP